MHHPTLSRPPQAIPFHADTLRADKYAIGRSAYAVMVADNGEPTETQPVRFGFCTPEHDAAKKLSQATLRTQLAASLLVQLGLARMGRDEWGEVLEMLWPIGELV